MSGEWTLADMEAVPEGSIIMGRVSVVHFIDEEGDPCYGWAMEGDIDPLNAVGFLEVMKARVIAGGIRG